MRGVLAVLAGMALGFAFTEAGVTVMRVTGESMAPTLRSGQAVVLIRPPLQRALERLGLRGPLAADGEVVAVRDPSSTPSWVPGAALLLKRVVATAGQTVAYVGGTRLIGGVPAREPWPAPGHAGLADVAPVTLADAEIYVVGDDRLPLASFDSRAFGPLPLTAVRGSAILVLRSPVGPDGWRWPLAALNVGGPSGGQ